jgi:hypothetical protein
VTPRNQVGPQGHTTFSGTVDCRYDFRHTSILVGELKKPGRITADWMQPHTVSTNKTNLGKELRGYVTAMLKLLAQACADWFRYAFEYNCPQTFCFDGLNLLILRFRAQNRADIKTCAVDCWVVPIIRASANTASIRYAFYRLMSEGFHRAVGQMVNPAVQFQQYTRYFSWYDGKLFWSDEQNTHFDLPIQGYQRRYYPQHKAWYWRAPDGTTHWDTTAWA